VTVPEPVDVLCGLRADYPPMGAEEKIRDWKHLEQLVMALQAKLDPGSQVRWNEKVIGKKSKGERQLDVTVRGRIGTASIFVAIDCKHYSENIDVGQIGESISLFDDVGAHGIVVTTKGFSESALQRAEADDVETCILREATESDWSGRVRTMLLRIVNISIEVDACSLVYVDGSEVAVNADGERVVDKDGKGQSLGQLVRMVLANSPKQWVDGKEEMIDVSLNHDMPMLHEANDEKKRVRLLRVRAHRVEDAPVEQKIDVTTNWVFVKVLPGNTVLHLCFVDFVEIDRIAQSDAACRAAVEALQCGQHPAFRPGVIITWQGAKKQEVRMHPTPCCDEMDQKMGAALNSTMRDLFVCWAAEDARRLRSLVERFLPGTPGGSSSA
jgi:Restriction endonuclease